MGQQNYRESIQKDRQEISVASSAAPTRRAARHSAKNQPKKKKSILLPTLFFLFILIPVTILIYVAFVYEPNDTITTKAESNEVSIETNSSPETPIVPVEVEEKQEQETAEEKAAEKAAQEKAAEEKAAQEKAVQEKAAQEKAAKAAEEAQKAAAEKQAAAQPKEESEEQPQQAAKTYVVKPQETLYRIAVNNYGAAGAAAAVEKIKQANGLASNSISVGQTIVLP